MLMISKWLLTEDMWRHFIMSVRVIITVMEYPRTKPWLKVGYKRQLMPEIKMQMNS